MHKSGRRNPVQFFATEKGSLITNTPEVRQAMEKQPSVAQPRSETTPSQCDKSEEKELTVRCVSPK